MIVRVQVSVLPASAELYQGDVFQFASLQNALGDANVLFIATGSRPALDPFGPFNIDFQVGICRNRHHAHALCRAARVHVAEGPLLHVTAAQGTVNLVEVARRAGVERVVLVSSIGADEPFFPLNLLFGVRTMPIRMLLLNTCGVEGWESSTFSAILHGHLHLLLAGRWLSADLFMGAPGAVLEEAG